MSFYADGYDAGYGDPSGANFINVFLGGVPVETFANVGGLWRTMDIFALPANLDAEPPPPPPPDTTVVNISDLLVSGETLTDPVDNTKHMQNCLDRIMRRSGPVMAAVATDHLTVDFEGTQWRCEGTLEAPSPALFNNRGVTHPCMNWPKGMTWQNGGFRQFTTDGIDPNTGLPKTTIDRNRESFVIASYVNRPEASNFERWFDWSGMTIRGSHDSFNYVLAREGQEGLHFLGAQWFRMTDCVIERVWGDATFLQAHQPNVDRDHTIHPGMIEILGGRFERCAIMNMTLNATAAPDHVVTHNYWRNDPDHVDNVPAECSAPSASGQQWGFWWHGNADHPFVSIDCGRSIIDMEPQLSFALIQDIRIGADVDKAHFQFLAPNRDAGVSISAKSWGMVRRMKWQHTFRDGVPEFIFAATPEGVIGPFDQVTDTIAAGSNGVALPTNTINVASTAGFPNAGQIVINRAGLGSTLVEYTGKTATAFTGCNDPGTQIHGTGTLATGAQVRNVTMNKKGDMLHSASNNVVLPAVGQLVNGDGFVYLQNGRPIWAQSGYVYIWTASGAATIFYTKIDSTLNRLEGCTVRDGGPGSPGIGTGWTLKTGQAVTPRFTTPERDPYAVGDIEFLDVEWTKPGSAGVFSFKHTDGLKVTKCKGPYRPQNVPFQNELTDVIHFDKGGTSQFGDNNFFPV